MARHWRLPFRNRADNLGLELSEAAPRNPTSSVPPPGHSGAVSPSYAIYFTPLSNWICGGSTKGLYGQTLLSASPSRDVASSQNGAFHAGAKGQCQAFLCLVSCALGSALFKELGSKAPRQEIFKQSENPGFLRAAIREFGKLHLLQAGCASNICPHRPARDKSFNTPRAHTLCSCKNNSHSLTKHLQPREKWLFTASNQEVL